MRHALKEALALRRSVRWHLAEERRQHYRWHECRQHYRWHLAEERRQHRRWHLLASEGRCR